MKMRPEHKVWWEELADQYEEWADNPPTYSFGEEMFTCVAMSGLDFGWVGPVHNYLKHVWREQYGLTEYPAGHTDAKNRPERRWEFCHYMAETIREALREKSW